MNTSRGLVAGIAAVGAFFVLMFAGKIVQNVDANEIVCIQSPFSGKLSWYTTAGPKFQGFGKVTVYQKLENYEFNVPVRFNDGGHGTLIGSLNYELPRDEEHLTQLHTNFGSQEAIQKALIEKVTNKCVYMTGPLMSSKESYAERRTSLISYIEDQITYGVYRTTQKDVHTKDPMTGADKTVTVVEIVNDDKGLPKRQEEPVLSGYGIHTSNFAVAKLDYEDAVEKQIKQQQELVMQVQTAIASAKGAEQRAITVAKEGEANAAQAKWSQEVVKAQKVTEAVQKKEVAELDAQAAASEKRANILRGEGEAERKRLVMAADGGLDPKLDAYIKVNEKYAAAIAAYGGNWVPQFVFGNDGGHSASGATDLLNLLTAKTARDLGIDLAVSGKDKTK